MSTNYSPKIVTSGLVLCLDASNGKSYPGSGTTWTDISRTGNNGTLTNSPTFSSENGGSIVFDGTDDYINFSQYNFGNEMTISCFFRPSLTTNIQTIFANTAGGITPAGVKFFLNNYLEDTRRITIEVGNGSTGFPYVYSETGSVVYDTWQHAACTISKTTALGRIYYNGNFLIGGTLGVTNFDTNRAFRIGRFTDNQHPFKGRISHYCIYNRVLSDEEIRQNYNATKKRFGL